MRTPCPICKDQHYDHDDLQRCFNDAADRVAALQRELTEARQGILECQTRILALESEIERTIPGGQIDLQAMWRHAKADRDEAHGQLAESYAAIREVPRICSCAGGAGICGFCLWREKHAPVIERATKHA